MCVPCLRRCFEINSPTAVMEIESGEVGLLFPPLLFVFVQFGNGTRRRSSLLDYVYLDCVCTVGSEASIVPQYLGCETTLPATRLHQSWAWSDATSPSLEADCRSIPSKRRLVEAIQKSATLMM